MYFDGSGTPLFKGVRTVTLPSPENTMPLKKPTSAIIDFKFPRASIGKAPPPNMTISEQAVRSEHLKLPIEKLQETTIKALLDKSESPVDKLEKEMLIEICTAELEGGEGSRGGDVEAAFGVGNQKKEKDID